MLLLAQASPSPAALKEWLEVLAYLCGVIAAVVVAWGYLTNRAGKTELANQPIDVRQHPGTVTRKEWEETHGRISRERKEVEEKIKALADQSERRTHALELKIDTNTEVTAATGATVDQMNLQLQQLNTHLLNLRNK